MLFGGGGRRGGGVEEAKGRGKAHGGCLWGGEGGGLNFLFRAEIPSRAFFRAPEKREIERERERVIARLLSRISQ